MRILLLNHEFTLTGASQNLLALGLTLKAAGHSIDVAALNPRPGPVSEAFSAAGAPIVSQLSLATYDVCIANTVAAAGFVGQLGGRLPTIWWLHEAEIGLTLLLQDTAQLSAFPRAAAIVFQTEFQRDSVYRSFTFPLDPGRLHVIPNGVSVEGRLAPDRIAPRQGVLQIVSAGTVYPRKRHSDIIEAVARLRTRLDVELVICGGLEGGLDARAEQRIAECPDRFRMTGAVSRAECLAWIASADIFCLASDSESQGNAILEAGMLHKPLVLSDLRCHEDRFRHGANCLLFPVGDVELLSHLLALLAADPVRRQALGAAAFETTRQYGERTFLARLVALVEDVAGLAR